MRYMGQAIKAAYGVAYPTASHSGPFSYAVYLKKLLKRQFWGDEIVLWSISMMWNLKISVINSKTLQEYRIRHDCTLRHVDVALMYNSQPTTLLQVSQVMGHLLYLISTSNWSLVWVATVPKYIQ